MSPPILFTFRRCPYAMRARMALAASGIAYTAVEVSLRAKPPELLAISPKGTVPVMQLADANEGKGSILDQSLDIMRWALAHNDPHDWLLARDATENVSTDWHADDMNRWIAMCDETFKPLLDRYKYWNRHPELAREAHRERALEAFIRPLNTRLALQGYVLGSRATLADVAIFPFVRQFAAVDSVWFETQTLPALQKWLGAWLNSAVFLSIMAKP